MKKKICNFDICNLDKKFRNIGFILFRNPESIGTHFFATAIEKNVQQTVAAAMTIVTTCNITFRSHPPLSRKPRLSIYTGDVLVTSSTVMLRTLKNGTAALGNHSLSGKSERES
ncbi:hypothetical protein TNCV_529701 [Trichonephila clavipes]|nr:hypothetical protein TNCV_529701 [Trichonephila clavipes]